jgi:hypothetical protein
MERIKTLPLMTDTFDSPTDFIPQDSSVYIFGQTDESRSKHISGWASTIQNIKLMQITEQKISSFFIDDNDQEILLRSDKSIAGLWNGLPSNMTIYIDITGLTHSVWAAILKSAIDHNFNVLVVYVEPAIYSRSSAPIEGQFYDLSERITEISPLPGFAVLSPFSSETIFIPLLGFEGTRLKYIIEQIQPESGNIIPVVGLPGFKPWYVFETLRGNKSSLIETDAWQSIKYAPGDCPFSCYYLLEKVYNDFREQHIKIAPIGTKPHALAAVMFSLNYPQIEIVYDHPVRKSGRTDGTSKLHVYHVSSIVRANPNRTAEYILNARARRKSVSL